MTTAFSARSGQVGRFQVLERLGAGGYGSVYAARDVTSGEKVALKRLERVDGDALFHFKREFRALQDLEHPNLVHFGELFEFEGAWFLTMELVEGEELLHYVRPGGKLDEARLRGCLSQLAAGLTALHASGKLHRDIKPANVRVTERGRVVLLDFGLATTYEGNQASTQNIGGTAAYMAPELANGATSGPTTDWYAVGVVLFEALCGRQPFEGNPVQQFMRKCIEDAPSPASLAPSVPPDLELLCSALLARNPSERPTGTEVLARLDVDVMSGARLVLSQGTTRGDVFIGRARELSSLREAWLAAQAGSFASVYVSGASGMGKSALVEHFVADLAAEAPSVLVLYGRCFERESMPYKAFDGLIDALSRQLVRLSDDQVRALMPEDAGLIARIFPVLGRVRAFARAMAASSVPADWQLLRRKVFGGLRELFFRLCAEQPLVLFVDDLHWTDVESLRLLKDLLDEGAYDASAGRAPLLIATGWPDDQCDTEVLASIRRTLVERRGGKELQLAGLEAEDARELTRILIGSAGDAAGASIAADAAGHPLFIAELVRHLHTAHGEGARRMSLEDTLRARIRALEPEGRTLLELLAVAGRPLEEHVALLASSQESVPFARAIQHLRLENLLRTRRTGVHRSLLCFHDRVRLALLSDVDEDARRGHHARIAAALARAGIDDPERLAHHWLESGSPQRAFVHARRAAELAARALAFARAVELYQTAVDAASEDEARRQMRSALADALAKAGRTAEAAETYLAALEGAPEGEAVELKSRAAQCLLRSGHVDEGIALADELMRGIGESMSKSSASALFSVLMQRAWLRVRGYGFKPRDATEVDEASLRRLDLLWSVGTGLGVVDFARGAELQTRALRVALGCGERGRVARALAIEAMFSGSMEHAPQPRGRALLARAEALAAELGDPLTQGYCALVRAGLSVASSTFAEGRAAGERGEALFLAHRAEVSWEITNARLHTGTCLLFSGELRELARRTTLFVREADERRDLFTATTLSVSHTAAIAMLSGDVEAARASVAERLARWPEGYWQLQRVVAELTLLWIDIYAGGGLAWDRWVSIRAELGRSPLLRTPMFRWMFGVYAGLAALESARSTQRPECLAFLRRQARKLSRQEEPYASAMGAVLGGYAELLSGDAERGVLSLRRAYPLLAPYQGAQHACGAVLAELIGGDEGSALSAAALAWARAQGARDPERLAFHGAGGRP